jgi:4-methyl-5(b-hydroxyethyl)-thiazole monophosphate biosynthesis
MPKVLIPLAQGCEELEAVTIIDILRRAGIEVTSAGLDAQPVRASRGVTLMPDTTLDAALQHSYDMVVLPDARILALLRNMASKGKHVAAICAAPSVLATAGLLDGKRATSYSGALDAFPKVLRQHAAVVHDGLLTTSRGPGTAMDFALALVEQLAGEAKRQEVETGLER